MSSIGKGLTFQNRASEGLTFTKMASDLSPFSLFLLRIQLSIVFSFHCCSFGTNTFFIVGTRQSLASIQHPCVNTKDINMSSQQPLSSNPGAQNTASQHFYEKPIPSQTNGTSQPPQAVRQRHQQGNASHGVSQRDHNYNSPIGGYRSSSDETATYRSHRSHDPHHYKRRQIRHRLHQKHKQDGPVPVRLKWTKFMHSDTKNRM